jgi:hypothetical protein
VKGSAVLVWLALMSIAACASAGDRPSTPAGDGPSRPAGDGPSAAADEFTLPSGSGRDAKSIAPGGPTSLTGVLTFDDIEGGCAFVQIADGTKVEVIYPAGWSLDRGAAVLRGPAGELVRAGATMTVRGAIATGRSSICQVGPIFEATAVEIPQS